MLIVLPELRKCFWLQILDAKVHQLDFSLERIFLSLKEITVTLIHGQWHYAVEVGF